MTNVESECVEKFPDVNQAIMIAESCLAEALGAPIDLYNCGGFDTPVFELYAETVLAWDTNLYETFAQRVRNVLETTAEALGEVSSVDAAEQVIYRAMDELDSAIFNTVPDVEEVLGEVKNKWVEGEWILECVESTVEAARALLRDVELAPESKCTQLSALVRNELPGGYLSSVMLSTLESRSLLDEILEAGSSLEHLDHIGDCIERVAYQCLNKVGMQLDEAAEQFITALNSAADCLSKLYETSFEKVLEAINGHFGKQA